MIPAHTASHNIIEQVPHPGTGQLVYSRIPDALRRVLNDNAQGRALNTCGCEIRFRLNGPAATIRLQACEMLASQHGGGMAQVLFGDFSQTYLRVSCDLLEYRFEAPDYSLLEKAAAQTHFHPRLVRLLLPTHSAISRLEIEGDLALPEPGDVPATRALFYGSSITQGSGSLSARESWAGRCAHLLGVDIINLGFGGGCHCEPEMTEYLVSRDDWDFAVLETGINMLGMEVDEANRRIEHLIRSMAKAHPEKPIFCVGVFPCSNDIQTQFQGRAREIHRLVRNLVNEIEADQLFFVDGEKALNPAYDLTADLTHPSPSGMISIAEYVSSALSDHLRLSAT